MTEDAVVAGAEGGVSWWGKVMQAFLWLWVGGGLLAPALHFDVDIMVWGLLALALVGITIVVAFTYRGIAWLFTGLALMMGGAALATFLNLPT